ncbi:MAG TPA: metallopeptidase TldD-related protein [Terriglobales bacterium]|nr:metallopeptidase TldD-related protein [Terriglobales bacterium]
MHTRIFGVIAGVSLVFCGTVVVCGTNVLEPQKADAALLGTMQQELQRARSELGKLDPAPYYVSYSVYDQENVLVIGGQGALMNSVKAHQRMANVIMHLGSTALDNTHEQNRSSGISSGLLPFADDRDAIARVLWQLTYEEYRKASKAYLNVKTEHAVRSAEEDTSADFSEQEPQNRVAAEAPVFRLDQKEWEERVRRYSGYFRKFPEVYSSVVVLLGQRANVSFVASDGSRVVTPESVVRLMVQAETRADDGMELLRVETFQASSPERLPSENEIAAKAAQMAADLKALRVAPLATPFDGPALLSGRAAAVFFHEVLGHRLEGHRQRGDEEGQTFTKKMNEEVLPKFLTVTDDPTQRTLNGVDLSGWYSYDDEGQPAARVEVIKNGILNNFLMSRIPVKGFAKSNGHGRAQSGLMATGRQGNLIVTSSQTVKDSELRAKLIEEAKKQGKPYGLYFEDIEGGFTLTTRALPQAFQILPVMVWRVYADGRADELVRGVDIVGTPLAALNRILITGEKMAVFNGVCGAESGSVPVSAVAPAMLFSELEVQKRAHSHQRPPILPPPGFENAGGSGAALDRGAK